MLKMSRGNWPQGIFLFLCAGVDKLFRGFTTENHGYTGSVGLPPTKDLVAAHLQVIALEELMKKSPSPEREDVPLCQGRRSWSGRTEKTFRFQFYISFQTIQRYDGLRDIYTLMHTSTTCTHRHAHIIYIYIYTVSTGSIMNQSLSLSLSLRLVVSML